MRTRARGVVGERGSVQQGVSHRQQADRTAVDCSGRRQQSLAGCCVRNPVAWTGN